MIIKVREAWNKRSQLYVEGDKLYAEGDKLYAEGNKLYAEGDKLYAEGNKLYEEGHKLCAEGDKLYAEGNKLCAEGNIIFLNAIIEVYGNIRLQWKDNECHLENGEVFKPLIGITRNKEDIF